MSENTQVKLFEDKLVRTIWDKDSEEWFFSVVDVIAVLTGSRDYQTARNYWKVLKSRLKSEGNETVTNCNRLKLQAEDGKMRLTDFEKLAKVNNKEQMYYKLFEKPVIQNLLFA